jgi:hypothetical protein
MLEAECHVPCEELTRGLEKENDFSILVDVFSLYRRVHLFGLNTDTVD